MSRKAEKIFWGLFFILGAVFIVVSGLGMLPAVSVFSLILTVVFAAWIIKSIISLHIEGIFFPLAFLGIIYAKPLGITAIVPWTILGAALLLTIGWSILFHNRFQWFRHTHKRNCYTSQIEKEDADHVKCDTSFGSVIKYINSEDFKQADLACSFGSIKAYFDKAQVKGEKAVINIDMSFSGIELYLPKNWHIINHIDASFGGVDEKNQPQDVTDTTVELVGEMSFSGLTIYYV